MRVITAAQQAVLDSGVQAEFVRLSVRDAADVFRDLTTYPGFNAVASLNWTGKIGSPHFEFTAELKRELFELSLSPYVEASALNRGFDPDADYAALIQVGREVKIEVAIVPMDTPRERVDDGDWVEFFSGRIDDHDSASGPNVSISGRGRISGRLALQYIKTELVYAFAEDGGGPVPLRIWEPQMAVADGETYVLPASRGDDDPGTDKFFKCSQSGTTGLTEPVWTTGAGQADGTAEWDYVGAPTTDGFDVEEIIQNILDDNRLSGDPAITLYTPSSPAWAIRQFIQQRGYTLDAVLALAHQIGWDARDKWREGTTQFEFTFDQPERDDPDVAFTFGPRDYKEPSRLKVDIDTIRNSWRVIYSDRDDLWPDGTAKRKVIEVQDTDSIDKYKQELWAEIREDENSNIDSATEATELINAALSDTSEPDAELALELVRGFPWVELNDFFTFSANGRWFDTAKSLAVTGWTQTFEEGGHLKTTLELRGKPTIGAAVHLKKAFHPTNPPRDTPHRLVHFASPKTVNPEFTPVIGGAQVKFPTAGGALKEILDAEYEVHVSPTPDFTPDDTTLISVAKATGVTIPDQEPETTYYGKTVPRWYNAGQLVRGQPSAEKAFVAGQGKAGHLKQEVEWGRLPLNGGFESWSFGAEEAPDHWSVEDDDFVAGNVVGARNTDDAVSGDSYLKYNVVAGDAELKTKQPFTIEKGTSYEVAWWVRAVSDGSTGAVTLFVRWLDWEKATISDDAVDVADIAGGDPIPVDGNWYRRSGVVTAPDDARFAQIVIKRTTAPDFGPFHMHIDSVRFERA